MEPIPGRYRAEPVGNPLLGELAVLLLKVGHEGLQFVAGVGGDHAYIMHDKLCPTGHAIELLGGTEA
ncbi:MAG TPA: hypothetical protein DEV93_03815, partial [Chloroflexi bacterium]|nr:hypothetical protein [Chloroflexota bacterium]